MDYMHKIKKMLCNELEEMAEKNKLSNAGDLEVIWKLTDTIKNLCKIEKLESEEGGYSEARRYNSYDDGGYSERRYARRDRMGRYSSENGSSYDERGNNGGYSMDEAKDKMLSRIGELMESANPKEREALKEAMRAIEKA